MRYQFEWNPAKAAANLKKHGVSFEQATAVFKDPVALTIYDEENSDEEERWITLGQVRHQHYLVVIHTYRDSNAEIKQYEG